MNMEQLVGDGHHMRSDRYSAKTNVRLQKKQKTSKHLRIAREAEKAWFDENAGRTGMEDRCISATREARWRPPQPFPLETTDNRGSWRRQLKGISGGRFRSALDGSSRKNVSKGAKKEHVRAMTDQAWSVRKIRKNLHDFDAETTDSGPHLSLE